MSKRNPKVVTPVSVGQRVCKRSGKPFKSGEKIGTVLAVIPHPVLPCKTAYTFVEDDSFMLTNACQPVPTEQ